MDLFEIVIYPFLFAAIYFQAFLLVTLLSAPAAKMRARQASEKTPKVAMIVPCWNEENTVTGTVESLLALQYPKDLLRIILVNDGSTDNTKAAMDCYKDHPQVTVIHKENGGKHTAINLGIEMARDAELIGCLDADSFVEPSALREIIACFDDPRVAAATPGMSVHKPHTILERMQHAEFVLGIALRHTLAAVNGLHVTPGPFSLYRRSVLEELGGFRFGHQTEDMEMALRIQKAGYTIDSAPRARVYTKVPRKVSALVKQRTRWTSGFLRNVSREYRSLIGNPRYGALGMIVLPLGFAAVAGGLIAFAVAAYQLASFLVKTYTITSGVPLSFTLGNLVPSLNANFAISLFMALALVSTAGIIAFIIVGKNVSKTPGSLSLGVIAYLFVYGLIAPFWLMRSVRDVATSTTRSWR